jgi:hypothetical protein
VLRRPPPRRPSDVRPAAWQNPPFGLRAMDQDDNLSPVAFPQVVTT